MQIKISTRHGHMAEATQDKIRGRVQRLERLFERLTSIEVTVDLEDSANPLVNLIVSAEHKHDFVAHEQTDELWKSVDGAVTKIEHQLRKYKEKLQGHHRGPAAEPLEQE